MIYAARCRAETAKNMLRRMRQLITSHAMRRAATASDAADAPALTPLRYAPPRRFLMPPTFRANMRVIFTPLLRAAIYAATFAMPRCRARPDYTTRGRLLTR